MAKLTTANDELKTAMNILGDYFEVEDIYPAAVLATEHLPSFVQYSARKELLEKLYAIYDTIINIITEEGE